MSFLRIIISIAILTIANSSVAQLQVQAKSVPATVSASDSNYSRDFRYQVQFADYMALRLGKPADLLFIGDSITEQFRWGPGNGVWKEYFERRAINFGKGGDRTQHVLWRLDHLAIDQIAPKVTVLLIGTNNQQDIPSDIADGIRAIIAKIHAKWPDTRILLLSILPNGRQPERMAAVNKLLPALADKKSVFYRDITQRFPFETNNWKGLQEDRLHLTSTGYESLADEINSAIESMTH